MKQGTWKVRHMGMGVGKLMAEEVLIDEIGPMEEGCKRRKQSIVLHLYSASGVNLSRFSGGMREMTACEE